MLRKRFILLFIVVAVGLGLLWIEDYTTQTTEENSEGVSQLPDYYGEGLTNRTFNEKGTLEHQFDAASSVHYPSQKHTELTLPKVKTLADNGEIWIIQSKAGTHFEKEDKLILEQDVLISPASPAELKNPEETVIIRTSKLTFFTESKIAKTDRPVQVTSQNGHIDAVGMIMTLDQQRVEFLSQVKSKYVP